MGTWTGACQCGAVRYVLTGELRMTYACHCTQCQRVTGGAFAMAAVYADARIAIEGPPLVVYVRGGPARRVRCHFCPVCGSRIHHQWFTDAGDIPFISVRPGTLDDTRGVRPDIHVWTQHAQPWIRFGPQDEVYPQAMPVERSSAFFRAPPSPPPVDPPGG